MSRLGFISENYDKFSSWGCAINANQIKVVFSTELDKTSAENRANYSLNGTSLFSAAGAAATDATVKLQADKKSVLITQGASTGGFQADLTVGAGYSVKVSKDLINAAGAKLGEDFTTQFTFADDVKPTVTSVKVNTSGKVVVEFSEPLKATAPVVKINGVAASVATPALDATQVVATPATTLEAGKTYTVLVAGAEDLVGNFSDVYETTVTTSGADVPTISSFSVVDEDTVKVTFSKELKADGAGKVGEFIVAKGLTQSAVLPLNNTALDPDDDSNQTYLVDINYDLVAGGTDELFTTSTTTSENINVYFQNYSDAFGNKQTDPVQKSATLVKDTVKPAFVKSQVAADFSSIDLTFSKDINTVTDAKFTVVDADGVPYALDATTDVDADDATVVHLVFEDAAGNPTTVAKGTYTVIAAAGAVTDNIELATVNGGATARNTSAAFTTNVTVGEPANTDKPVYAIADANDADNSFEVSFGTEVKGGVTTVGSAVNPANYKLDGKALPEGTIIRFTDADKDAVTITLPEGSVNAGKPDALGSTTENKAILTVSGVQASESNKVGDVKSATVYLVDNTAAELQAVQVLGNDIYLTFNEAIDATTAAAINTPALLNADFEILVGTKALELGVDDSTATGGSDADVDVALVPGNDKQVKITLTPAVVGTGGTVAGDGVASNWDSSKTITVKVLADTLLDANQFGVKADVTAHN